ncbi:AMP-binding protein [Streptomyces sp. BE303]|uniref:AMP-binding protein n=1 Tax=Streptomyces sp. BE303 TaxID=3002528 RepID=UPI002E76C9AA|nr:AMP-binding protein [Streptomyces sp. BE303]MED7952019.1 AMP-binding protein [Streptomyces sp. BE303]
MMVHQLTDPLGTVSGGTTGAGLGTALPATGLRRGDGVTVLAGNRPEAVLVRVAANLIGCRVAMLHTDRPVADQIALAESAGTAAFVFGPARFGAAAARIGAELPSAELLALGPTGPGTDLLEPAAPLPAEPVAPRFRPEDAMAVRFTGGSTGRPKGGLRRSVRPPRPELVAATVRTPTAMQGY